MNVSIRRRAGRSPRLRWSVDIGRLHLAGALVADLRAFRWGVDRSAGWVVSGGPVLVMGFRRTHGR